MMKEPTDHPTRLNVVFHGPFLFAYYEGRLEAITPEVPEHIVIAGTWLDEKLCTGNTFYLTGIKTPQTFQGIDDRTHAVVSGYDVQLGAGPYYRFVLPPPWSQTPVAPFTVPDDYFTGTYAGDISAETLGTCHVITYHIGEQDHPQLQGLQWLPRASPYHNAHSGFSYAFAINLHIYSDSAYAPDPEHPFRDLAKIAAMMPNLSLGLALPVPDNLTFDDPSDSDSLGIIREEQGGLRGLPPKVFPFSPPLVCDAPSLVALDVKDPQP